MGILTRYKIAAVLSVICIVVDVLVIAGLGVLFLREALIDNKIDWGCLASAICLLVILGITTLFYLSVCDIILYYRKQG